MTRDIDIAAYPLPCDAASGVAWYKWNVLFILYCTGWRDWQGRRQMAQIIPVLRWMIYGAVGVGAR